MHLRSCAMTLGLTLTFVAAATPAAGQPVDGRALSGWKHSATVTLLTTPDGANLPPTAVVTDFPVLVRLHRDWFDFNQARPDGSDIRFSAAGGTRLTHQGRIEQPCSPTS